MWIYTSEEVISLETVLLIPFHAGVGRQPIISTKLDHIYCKLSHEPNVYLYFGTVNIGRNFKG